MKQFWHVTLPGVRSVLIVVILLRGIWMFNKFDVIWLLTKGGPARMTEVLAVYLYQAGFRYGDFGVAAATGWVMVLGSLLLASFYLVQMHRRMVAPRA